MKIDDRQVEKISRRTYIGTAGASLGILTGLSGCIDGSNSDGGDGNDGGDGADGDGGDEVAYPQENKNIETIIPNPPGGGNTYYGQLISSNVSEYLPGDPDVVVNHMDAGSGMAASNHLWNAAPDGHKMLVTIGSSLIFQELTRSDAAEFSFKEFSFLSTVARLNVGIVRRPGIDPIENMDELEHTFKNLVYGAVGSVDQVDTLMIGVLTDRWGPDSVHQVVHGGSGDAMAALDRGDSDFTMLPASSASQYIDDDVVEPVVLFSDEYPQLEPTASSWSDAPLITDWVDEATATNLIQTVSADRVIFAPPDLPTDVHETLSGAIVETTEDEAVVTKAEEDGRPLLSPGLSAEQTREAMVNVYDNYADQEWLKDILS